MLLPAAAACLTLVACTPTSATLPAPVPVTTGVTPGDPDGGSSAPIDAASTAPWFTADCLAAANLPAGIDPRVCGELPDEVDTFAGDEYGFVSFALPSKNILCQMPGSTRLICTIIDYVWEPAPDPSTDPVGGSGEYTGQWAGWYFGITNGQSWLGTKIIDGLEEPSDILQYGHAVTNGTMACVSQSIGLTCWDTATGHGFWVSRTERHFW